jgi:hypothetical protein
MSESEPTNGRFLGYKPPSYEEAIDKSFQAVRRADSVRRKENKYVSMHLAKLESAKLMN